MIHPRTRTAVLLVLVSVAIASLSFAVSAVEATVLTNTGHIASGTLAGIGPVIRLSAPDEVSIIGPDRQFDVPLSSIVQITLDFPRVVIEATDRVLIGPYSAFQGIDEALRLERSDGSVVTIPTSSLRAIAFAGHALRPVPREWMGDRYLSEPEILAASPLTLEAGCDDCSITPPRTVIDQDDTPIWNDLEPQVPIEEEPAGLPWWLGLAAFVVVVVIAYMLT
ncbi:hypothetical protein KJ567_03005 [Candidatus Bipolaricaulota bacterium]|nr:hypothetical protein [Candidatus Bipolaricaulota bacterium]